MKRATFETLWTKEELNKVFNAIARYNKTFEDKIIIEQTKENDEDNYTWLTISYIGKPDTLMWFGILLGREGL